MENSSGVGLNCCDCGSEHGSTRLESPHGVAATPASDHSTSNLSMSPQPQLATSVGDHHYVAAALSANAKIIERAGIKENTLLPNGRIKQHRSDENGLINHHVLQTGGSPSTDTSGLLSNTGSVVNTGVNTTSSSIGGGAEKADDINKYEQRCPTQNASSKNVTNNQSSSSSTISGGDAHDKKDEVEDGITGDGSKPLLSSGVGSSSSKVQSRTYQSHGDQVDSISQQIDTLNISPSTRDNTSETTTIINNTTAACECDGHHVDVTTANSDDDDDDDEGTAGLVPCSHSAHDADCCHTVAVVNDDNNNNNGGECPLEYRVYQCELQMADIMRLITRDLSEPYSIYTYRYFIHNWPKLCFLCMDENKCVGAIVCKLDIHKRVIRRGYIAMLAVDAEYRRRKIGSNLVLKAIRAMLADGCDEVVLETEITNKAALKLYENLGFVRDKRLFRYYLNGVDALRLKLWLR